MELTSNNSLSIEESDVGERGDEAGEVEAVGEGKDDAEVDAAVLGVGLPIDLKLIVDDGGDIILVATGVVDIHGEEGEGLDSVEVETPVGDGNDHVDDGNVSDGDVDNGEEGRDERAAEVGGDGGPVEGERRRGRGRDCRNLGCWLGRSWGGASGGRTHDGECGEEIAGENVPAEAAYEGDYEES